MNAHSNQADGLHGTGRPDDRRMNPFGDRRRNNVPVAIERRVRPHGRRLCDRIMSAAAAAGLATVISAASASAAGMMWSSFLGGGSNDQINGTTTDAAGNIYVVGTTYSGNYPAVGGGYRSPSSGNGEVMVAKFTADGSTMLWSALLGGSAFDDGRSIAVDGQGNVFVTGNTASTSFPATAGAYRPIHSGMVDGFVAKLSPAGALMFSSFFGGARQDWPMAIRVDGSGNPIIAGTTESNNFPTTAGVVKSSRPTYFWDAIDGFVTKLNANGSALMFSTYVGTTASDAINNMTLDAAGQPIVVGWTASKSFPTTTGAYDRSADNYQEGFVTKLNTSGTAFVFSTYLGGGNQDEPRAVGLDAAGNVFVSGMTASRNFALTASGAQRVFAGGLFDAFLVVLSPNGGSLTYGTLLGGAGDDRAYGICVESNGNVVLTGETNSTNFPMTASAFDASANGGIDAFVARFAAGQLIYSSYLGSAGTDRGFSVALQPSGRGLVAGQTNGNGFPGALGYSSINSPGFMDGFFSCWDFGTASAQTASIQSGYSSIAVPASFVLGPNPFRGRAALRLMLSEATTVAVRIRDIQGRVVRDLADEWVGAGQHTWTWDATDNDRRAVSPGVYLVQMTGDRVALSRTITVLK